MKLCVLCTKPTSVVRFV